MCHSIRDYLSFRVRFYSQNFLELVNTTPVIIVYCRIAGFIAPLLREFPNPPLKRAPPSFFLSIISLVLLYCDFLCTHMHTFSKMVQQILLT